LCKPLSEQVSLSESISVFRLSLSKSLKANLSLCKVSRLATLSEQLSLNVSACVGDCSCYDPSGMLRFALAILRRLLIVLPVLWPVVPLVFLLIHIVPGDPARNLAGENASEQQVQAVRAELGLDKPLLTQYSDYWRGLTRGDWGVNPVTHEPVLSRIA